MNEFKEMARMCKAMQNACHECKLSMVKNGKTLPCGIFAKKFPDEASEIVHEWAEENPVRTRKDVLLEKYPNVRMTDDGEPCICTYDMGIRDENECLGLTCLECWLSEADE